jgi:hypothetical protein
MPRFTPYLSTLARSKRGVVTKAKDDHRYNALRNLGSHSDSDTDVEEWEEEADIQPRQRKKRAVWKRIKPYRWMLDTALLLVIVGLLAEKRWEPRKGYVYELAGDISGFAPTCTATCHLIYTPTLTIYCSLSANRQLQVRSCVRPGKCIRFLE